MLISRKEVEILLKKNSPHKRDSVTMNIKTPEIGFLNKFKIFWVQRKKTIFAFNYFLEGSEEVICINDKGELLFVRTTSIFTVKINISKELIKNQI